MNADSCRRPTSVTWVVFVVSGCLFGCTSSQNGAATATSSACAVARPAMADWHLSATGTTFRDALGRVVFLRGVDGGGRSKFAPYVPFDYAPGGYAAALGTYMDRAASWGIDVMRVPFTWAALEPTSGVDDADWLSRYDQLLDAAWARGIYTILDFHQDVYSEVYCGDGFPGWTVANPPAPHHDCPNWSNEYLDESDVMSAFDAFWAPGSTVQAQYLAAWDRMVARYASKPGVLGFEPINEPSSGSADDGTFAATTLTAFYSTMVGRMRAQAPESLVFVDLTGEDGVLVSTMLQKPSGDGVVFTPHFYPLNHDPAAIQSGLQVWADLGSSWNVPVMVDEFGISNTDPTAPAYMAAHFAAFDALGLSGSAWEYSVSKDNWNDETFSVVDADGGDLPVVASVVRPYARAVGGESVAQAYDPASGIYTLSYTATSGVTEVSIPEPAYAAGYDVKVTGACADVASVPGMLLLQPVVGAADAGSRVSLAVIPKAGDAGAADGH